MCKVDSYDTDKRYSP